MPVSEAPTASRTGRDQDPQSSPVAAGSNNPHAPPVPTGNKISQSASSAGSAGDRGAKPTSDAAGNNNSRTTPVPTGNKNSQSASGAGLAGDRSAMSTAGGSGALSNQASESMDNMSPTATPNATPSPAVTSAPASIQAWGSDVASATSAIQSFRENSNADTAAAALAALSLATKNKPSSNKNTDKISSSLQKMHDNISDAKSEGTDALKTAAETASGGIGTIGNLLTGLGVGGGGGSSGGGSGSGSGGEKGNNGEESEEEDDDHTSTADEKSSSTTETSTSDTTTSTTSSTTSTSPTTSMTSTTRSSTSATTSTSPKSSMTSTTKSSTSASSTSASHSRVLSCSARLRPTPKSTLSPYATGSLESLIASESGALGSSSGFGFVGGLGGSTGKHSQPSSVGRRPTAPSSARASPTPTGQKLKHGADPHSGGNYCQDGDGNKFSTAKAPTPSKAYDPCSFAATETPIPYDTPSKSTMVTDSKGTVWFCPSATPNDARVWSSYDCGPTSISQSVVPSIASAYEDRVASASASASTELIGNFMWVSHTAAKLAVLTPKWALYGRQVPDQVDFCEQDPDQSFSTTQSFDQKHVPWPPSTDGINDVKIGDYTFSGCKYTNTGNKPGKLKCDGYKEVNCIEDRFIGMIATCAKKRPLGYDWYVHKVNCQITEGDSEGKLPL